MNGEDEREVKIDLIELEIQKGWDSVVPVYEIIQRYRIIGDINFDINNRNFIEEALNAEKQNQNQSQKKPEKSKKIQNKEKQKKSSKKEKSSNVYSYLSI